MASRHIGSVYIRVVPDTKDFRRQTQRAFDRMEPFKVPVEVEVDRAEARRKFEAALDDVQRRAKPHKVDVTPDMEGFEADVDEGIEKATRGKDFTVKVTSDVDGVMDALATMERELAALQRTREITFDLNVDDIESKMQELREELRGEINADGKRLTAEVEVRANERSYRDLIRKIDEIQQARIEPEPVRFDLDDDSLRDVWDDAHNELARLQSSRPLLPEKLMLEYEPDRHGLNEAIRELRTRLHELGREKVTIPVDLDEEGLQTAITGLTRQLNDQEVVTYRTRVDPFTMAMTEGQLAVAARDRWVDLRPRIARSAMRDISGAFAAIAGLNSIRTLVDQIRNIALSFDEWAFQIGTASAAIGSLVSVGITGLGALLSVASDTLQIFQGIAAAPTLMLSGATALQTWTAIWQDFDAALQGIPGVLEEMPPAAQDAVGAIEDLNEAVNQSVQQNFWGQMTDEVERFTESIGPHITMAMGETARVMGRVMSNMLDYTEILAEGGSLDRFTRNHTNAMESLGDAGERVFRALMNMGIQGSNYLPALGRMVDDLAIRFEAFINDALVTGKFDLWIINAVNSLRSLGQAIGATWDIFAGFTKAFQDIGGPGLHEMADGLDRVADWVNSSGVQDALRNMYRDAIEGASAAGRGFADLTRTAWDYRDALGEVLIVSGELAGSFLTSLANVNYDTAFRGFFDLMDGLEDFVRRAQPAFESISNIFGRLGSIGGEVAREVAHGMNLTMDAIDGFIARIEGPLINAIHPLTRVFEDLAALGTPVIWALGDGVGRLLDLFSQLPSFIQNAVTMLAILGRTGALTGLNNAMGGFRRNMEIARRSVDVFATGVETRFQTMRARIGTSMQMIGRTVGRGFGGLVGALGGPWGIAITTAIGLLSSFAGEQAQAKAEVDALTDSLIHQGEVGLREQVWQTHREELEAFGRAGGDVNRILDEILAGRGDEVSEELLNAAAAAGNFGSEGNVTAQIAQWLGREVAGASDETKAYGEAARILGLRLQGTSGEMDVIRENAALQQEALGGAADATEDLGGAMDGLPPSMEALAEAMAVVADEAANADQRSEALLQTLKLLNGEELSSDELMRNAVDAFNNTMDRVERIANDTEFDWSNVFTKDGAIDYTVEGNQIKGMVDDFRASFTDRIAANKIKLEDEAIDYSQDDFDAFVADLESEWSSLGETLIKELNLTGKEAEQFRAMWDEHMIFDPVDIEMSFDNENNAERAKEQFETLKDLGLEIDQSKWVAEMDVDGNNAIDNIEYAQGMVETFDGLYAEAEISGDDQRMQEIIDAAWEFGFAWDGENFHAVIDANGEPNREAFKAAWEQGRIWHEGSFVTEVDANTDPATDSLLETINQADGLWVNGEYVAKLDADGHPTEEVIQYARSLGLEWNGSEFVAVVDSHGDGAIATVTEARERHMQFEGVYQALLEAEYLPSAAEAIATAIAESEEYEGDYQAFLEAIQTEEGRQNLIEFIEGLEEIPEETRSDIIASIEGGELLTILKNDLDELDQTEASPKVDADTEEAEGKVQGVRNDLREYSTIEPTTKVDADTEEADNKIDSTTTSAQRLGLLNPLVSLGIIGDDHVINRSGEAEGAANRVEGPRLATLLSAGAPAVVAAAFSAFTEADKVDGNFLAVLLSTGAAGVISQASAAFTEADTVDDVFMAIFGETGAGHVMGQAGGIQGAISRIDRNPVVTFVGRVASSFWNAISRIRSAISGVSGAAAAAGVGGLLSRNGSLTGSRFKPEMFRAFANGGVERHVAQIAMPTPSTPIRIWAEPETHGEAYIPLAPSKRTRSLQIWRETGRRLGAFEDGGIVRGVSRTSQEVAGGDVYNIRIEGSDVTVKDLMNEVTHQRRRSGRR